MTPARRKDLMRGLAAFAFVQALGIRARSKPYGVPMWLGAAALLWALSDKR